MIETMLIFIKDHFFANTKIFNKLCQLFQGQHEIWSCEQFKKLEVYRRWDFIRHSKLCFRCLGQDTWEIHVEGADFAALTIVSRCISDYCTLNIEL